MLCTAILLSTIVVILTPFFWWFLNLRKFRSLDQIPGPKPLPIIGNAHLVGTNTKDLLESLLQLHKQYGPVVKLWLGPHLLLMLTKAEIIEFFLTSTVHLSKSSGYDLFRPWLNDGLLTSTGSKWRQRRKIITPTFHFNILEKFLIVFNYQINTLIDNLLEQTSKIQQRSIEITHYINLCTLDIICETAFGTKLNSQLKSNPKYVEAVTGFLEIFISRFFSGWMRNPLLFRLSNKYRKYVEYLRILHNFTNGIISKRKEEFKLLENNQTDNEENVRHKIALLDMLLKYSDNGKYLNDEDIREEVDTFMFAGYDTTASAISFTLYAIAENPDVQKKIYDELITIFGKDYKQEITSSQIQDLKYLDIAIKEAMRIYPPVPLIERRLEEDCTVDGFTIPKDTNISIFLYGMNHSSDIFPEPEKFNIDRFLPENQAVRHNFAYLPFSAGPRNCIGQRFALLELKAALAKLLMCFEFEIDRENLPQIGICSVLKSQNGVHLKLKQRQ